MAEETKIIRIVVDSSRAVEGSAAATRALERMERAQGQTATSLERLEKSLGRVGGYLKAQLAIMAAEAASRIIQIGRAAFEAASGMGELADQLGVTTTGLQALQFSAVQNGLKMEQLETSVSKFSQKIGEAAGGSKEMLDSLNALGVKILDFNGNLRPTETLMTEVARAILSIDDPAKRAAASVDFFGKAGTKMQPMLADIAKGFDNMGAAAARGGAMMSEHTISRLDQIADASARAGLKMRAMFANTLVDALDIVERQLARINVRFNDDAWAKGDEARARWAAGISDFFGTTIPRLFDEAALAGGRFVMTFIAYFKSIPEQLPKLFIDALNASISAIESGMNEIGSTLATKYPWLSGKAGISGEMVRFGRLDGGGANTASERISSAQQAGADWEAGKRAEFAEFYARQKAARDRAALIARQAGMETDEGRARFGGLAPVSAGASNPLPKGSGDAVGDKITKLLGDSARELEQARAFAEAANQGAEAVANLEIHFKSLKAAQDAFGKTANDNVKGVAELTSKLEEQALATQKLKNLGDFRVGTQSLREQNELLEAEVRLAGELPEIRNRELAILKVMQEVRAKGLQDNKQDIEDRIAVMETNEQLKRQAEELKRATELWTEPVKTALSSIQTTAADAFEKMLESGKFNLEELGQVFKKTVLRMAAEFMALATVRPVMSVLVNAVSPGMATTFGLGQTALPGGGSSSGGSFGLGGIGSMFGGVSDFLSKPIASIFSSGAPAGGFADIGALLQSGGTGASASAAGIGGLGGISIGQGLGAIGGIGMGAYTLLSGKGSTASTIGGIGQMIGGAVSLIPGIGQIAGPIISVLSAVLPSLIGEPDTRTHNSTNATLRYGVGGYGTSGGAWGPGANVSQSQAALGSVGSNVNAVYDLLGGVKDASKVWGMDLSSWTASGKDWSYTSRATHLVDPSGNRSAWRMNEDNMVDTASAQVAMRSILGGAVGAISQNMRTAVTAMLPATTTLQDVAKGVSFVTDTYDKLGKTLASVEPDFVALEKTFKEMSSTATSLNLSLAPIEAEQKKRTERLAQDYIDSLIDPIAVELRAWEDERATILANVDYIDKHTDAVVDMARVNAGILRKEAELKERLYGASVAELEAAIRRLMPGGNLANVDPSGTLAGLKASYQSTYAQAAAGDMNAVGRFSGEATALAEYAQSYFAGSPEYNALKLQIIEALQTIQSLVTAPVGTTASEAAANSNGAQMQQLMASFESLMGELKEQKAQNAKLTAVLSRFVTTQAA